MLPTTERQLTYILRLVTPGTRIHVVGGRGTGRTFFLQTVRDRLVARRYEVVFVRGIDEFRTSPLVALGLAGMVISRDGRAAMPITAVAELTRRAEPGRLVIIVDDWDELDEASRGVIEAVRRTADATVIVSKATTHSTAFHAVEPAATRAFVLELEPLGFDELSTVVSERVNGVVDDSALSRIFAKSGGVVGIAIAIVDAALTDQRLKLVQGVWQTQGELWSPVLRGSVEAHLEAVHGDDRVALEKLSLAGTPDIEECVALIGWDALERLEAAGVVHLATAGDRRFVTVFPPLIVEYFRHESLSARQLRLETEVSSAIGRAAPALGTGDGNSEETEAILVRLLQEQQRMLRLAAQGEWLRGRRASSGIRFARLLWESDAEIDEVERLLTECESVVDTDEDRAALTVLTARVHLLRGANADAIVAELRAARARAGQFAGLLDAFLAEVLIRDGRADSEIEPLLVVEPGLPDEVAGALHETAALHAVVRGRFERALQRLAESRMLSGAGQTNHSRMLEIVATLGRGQLDEAAQAAVRFLDEAKVRLDLDAVWIASYCAALCLVAQGRLAAAFEVVRLDSALGRPSPPVASFDFALDTLRALIPFRQGERRTFAVDSTVAEGANVGPLPFMSSAWLPAHRFLAVGDVAAAGGIFAAEAERLWGRGMLFEAALLAMEAIEATSDREIHLQWRERLASIEGDFMGLRLRYLDALVSRDPVTLFVVAEELVRERRLGIATSALRSAENWSLMRSEPELQGRARAFRYELEKTADIERLQDRRHFRAAFELSERELQVANRVVDGLTNQQIADELVLSVRTVESHVHNAMKKLGAESRRQLREPLADYAPTALRR